MAASPAKQAPYFFLSHSRTDGSEFALKKNQDSLLELFHDLCHIVHEITAGSVGYLDIAQPIGRHWPSTMGQALSTCHVLVPLYSTPYFASEWCGKEWAGFATREDAQRERGNYVFPAIVPILWVGVPTGTMPRCVREISFMAPELGPDYREHGIFGLQRLDRTMYDRAVYVLARHIINVAKTTKRRSLVNGFS